MSRLIDQTRREIARSASPVAFETTGDKNWPIWDRYLTISGQRIYHLGNICGTCEYLFERLGNAADQIDVGALADRLNAGLGHLHADVVDSLALLMPARSYDVGLFSLCTRSVTPGSNDDYFAVEQNQNQFEVRGDEPAHDPKTPYYRIGQQPITLGSSSPKMLFEFVVPMLADSSLDSIRIRDYENSLSAGMRPTAVALSLLDVKGPYRGGVDHWCLTHFLLDGHHKMAAAARSGRPLTLVSFIDRDLSVADPKQIEMVLEVLRGATEMTKSGGDTPALPGKTLRQIVDEEPDPEARPFLRETAADNGVDLAPVVDLAQRRRKRLKQRTAGAARSTPTGGRTWLAAAVLVILAGLVLVTGFRR